MIKTVVADATPDQEGVFVGLAKAPLHFHHIVGELIDNAISAKPEKFNIHIDISETETPNMFKVMVRDDCGGISLERLEHHVFKLGKRPPLGSHHLSEHGYGLKNVLAKIETEKGKWEIRTRDEKAVKKGECYHIRGPLKYNLPIEILSSDEWPEPELKTGTIVKFTLPLTYIQTVCRGRKGAAPSSISKLMDFLGEHLGVFYRGYLEGKKPIGSITTSINGGVPEVVEEVEPDFEKAKVEKIEVRTRKGKIIVTAKYGEINPDSSETKKRVYYYRNSAESQGADFRVGRRVIATRFLTEIWLRPRHPTLNKWNGELKIDPTAGLIPRTLNNKTSIDFDDEIWQDIAAAVRNTIKLPKWKGAREEAELREELANQLRAASLPGENVQETFDCFGGAGVCVDIVHERGKDLIVYETKAGTAHPLDVYQLKLYWDGMVEDGKQPTLGRLVAKSWTPGTERVIRVVNTMKGKNGRDYRFELKKWEDFQIVA